MRLRLVIKLYSDRASRIGILYESGFKASKAYRSILETHLGETFRARFEFAKDKITVSLASNESSGRIEYREIDYDKADLKKLSVFIKPNAELEFVHIYNSSNKLTIARPNIGQMKFIIVNSYEIILPNKINNSI
jgi:hypothetical protein